MLPFPPIQISEATSNPENLKFFIESQQFDFSIHKFSPKIFVLFYDFLTLLYLNTNY